jgi:hypothetical protein
MPERSGGRRNQSLADTVPTSQGASQLCVHDISRGPRLSWDTRLTSLDQKSKWGDTRLDDSPIAVGWSRADQTRRRGQLPEEITQAVIEMTLLQTQRSICSLETDPGYTAPVMRDGARPVREVQPPSAFTFPSTASLTLPAASRATAYAPSRCASCWRDDSVSREWLLKLCFQLCQLLGTRVRNSSIRCLAALRSGPSTGFDELSLLPRLDLLELAELRGRAWLLHESRNAGGGQGGDHSRAGSFGCHPLGTAAESPA